VGALLALALFAGLRALVGPAWPGRSDTHIGMTARNAADAPPTFGSDDEPPPVS